MGTTMTIRGRRWEKLTSHSLFLPRGPTGTRFICALLWNGGQHGTQAQRLLPSHRLPISASVPTALGAGPRGKAPWLPAGDWKSRWVPIEEALKWHCKELYLIAIVRIEGVNKLPGLMPGT